MYDSKVANVEGRLAKLRQVRRGAKQIETQRSISDWSRA